MPGPEQPTPSAPAVAVGAITEEEKTEEVKEETTTQQDPSEPKAYWKFAIKAAHLKVIMLAGCMEFSKPKRIMYEFAEPVLKALLKQFVPDIF